MAEGEWVTYVGCEEWQESRDFATFEEVEEYMGRWRAIQWTLGAYTADLAYAENAETGKKVEYEIA